MSARPRPPNVTRSLRRVVVELLAFAGATIGFVHAYGLPFDWNRGVGGGWWEPIRRHGSRLAGALFDGRAGPRPVTDGELAGTLPMSLDDAEALLRAEGFLRNPFSRLKTRGGRSEVGSWVYRDSPLARRQLHLMLFDGDGGVDVYAHEEPSNVHPFLGATHFRGGQQRVAAGVALARDRLPLDDGDGTVDPIDGPWHEHPDVSRQRDGTPPRRHNGF